MLRIGIVGLPNAGKSTAFNALTGLQVPADSYPFCTVDPNSAVLALPDERLARLARATGHDQLMPVTVELWDIAGLVPGAHRGIGLGNEFLHHIRSADVILHVVRAFDDSRVSHEVGSVDPLRDVEIIEHELAMADLGLLDKHRIAAKSRLRNTGDPAAPKLHEALDRAWRTVRDHGKLSPGLDLTPDQVELLRQYQLLTTKPTVILVNTGSGQDGNHLSWSNRLGGRMVVAIRAEDECLLREAAGAEERAKIRAELNLKASVDEVVGACYEAAHLVTFYTFGQGVSRAWAVRRGTTAVEAAALIHSDFADSFIRVQIFRLEDLERHPEAELRQRGGFRTEGRLYQVQDGDVLWVVTKP